VGAAEVFNDVAKGPPDPDAVQNMPENCPIEYIPYQPPPKTPTAFPTFGCAVLIPETPAN
jgi:hypothetical protein